MARREISRRAIDLSGQGSAPVGMERKSHIDTFGAVALVLFALNLGFNQVVIKVTNGGFNPVFLAGLRSLGAVLVVLVWMRARGLRVTLPRAARAGGIAAGLFFSLEFVCLFIALDLTTVSRASVTNAVNSRSISLWSCCMTFTAVTRRRSWSKT